MYATLTEVLEPAAKHNYSVGHFNVNNMEIIQSVLQAGKAQKSPVILGTSEGAIRYAGIKFLKKMVDAAVADYPDVPVVLHLDHGTSSTVIHDCIKHGWTSIMFDGSHLPLQENLKVTKEMADLCHKNGVSIEGELGTIGGVEDDVSSREIIYTEPDVAAKFVKQTKVDALAIAIGTSHGAYKFSGEAKLDIGRLKVINEMIKIPLVLHGASCVPQELLDKASHNGAQLGHPEGVPEEQVKRAIENGINKINTDTDIRLAFLANVREFFNQHPEEFDPRKFLGYAREEMQKMVEHRIEVFGSGGKA
ncbi:MAG: class II fructose-1,6-bisphosphate aldolase [Candidatus Woesearchaeota archaeon]|jgi:fructose-bisphosphate aldolase class II|nr:class II fructose-1,6-bisphosphate aldolase [Candidatus Woesearchaeota archaeon]MDP7198123.1 class II fructose-1,6-bisphosphate aldolase [Candidatus Woesearchaeota archaeon]MDP7466957.1 class II fructose-1,6-bisphosphate aldolase [Candidatus Woesearchaeota archaeon]MDP7646957.1 class II fructose-1,6-bisphosphate aldolase [Candidatus Woesearchaeota archaeon]